MAKKKKKPKVEPVVEVEADEEDVSPKANKGRAADDEDPMKPRARYDVYFGLTLLTTLILIGSAVMLYLDQEDLKAGPNAGFSPPSVAAGPLGSRAANKN